MNIENLTRQINRLADIYDCKCVLFNDRGQVLLNLGMQESILPGTGDLAAYCQEFDLPSPLEGRQGLLLELDNQQKLGLLLETEQLLSDRELELIKTWLAETLSHEYGQKERITFLKNVLLENELPGDIPLKARTLKVDFNRPRKAILLRMQGADDQEAYDLLQHLFTSRYENYFVPMDENNILILFDLDNLLAKGKGVGDDNEVLEEAFDQLMNAVISELEELLDEDVRLGVGLAVNQLKDISRSYREASLALTVGAIFEEDQHLMRYDQLGLGRLIYQLPPTLCELFLTEVFKPGVYEQLDAETLVTIEKFFENNLNGSETSRKLFVHRNTLVYRLDKVEKITGLDLRIFDDAVLFKLASMVRKYLETLKYSELGSESRPKIPRK